MTSTLYGYHSTDDRIFELDHVLQAICSNMIANTVLEAVIE